MNNKTETYIILKPIAERFNRISKAITDDEIKSLIKCELSKQIREIDFKYEIEQIIGDYLEEKQGEVLNLFLNGLKEKFK